MGIRSVKNMMSSKSNRGKVWSEEATHNVNPFVAEESTQISLDTCETSKQTSKVYQILLVSEKIFVHDKAILNYNFID